MSAYFELLIKAKGVTSQAVAIGKEPFSVGRAPTSDLIVSDGLVSWDHLKIWVESGQVWVSDAGSTNGTFVNGNRIKGTTHCGAGDVISIGDAFTANVQLQGEFSEPQVSFIYALEQVDSGMKHPFRGQTLTIGSSAGSDLRIPALSDSAARFSAHGEGDLWVTIDDDDHAITVEEEVRVGAFTFRVVRMDPKRQPTINPTAHLFPYRLSCTLDGPTGPVAVLENLDDGTTCRIEAETRAILLYLLGSHVAKHQAAGITSAEECGWCPDDDVIVGVWGRSGLADGANRLKVLVHRLRAEIRKSGFDPWFIERRRRYIRARIKEVSLT